MKIYSKGGNVLAEVSKFQYNGTFMGESYLTFDVDSPEPINFEIGAYAEYRGEKYELNYTPAKLKASSSGSTGNAFKYKGLKFNSLADELTRCDFLDFVLNENRVHFSNLPNFSFYAQSVQELADRLQANLNRVYTGDKQWTVTVEPSFVSTEQNVVINNIKCWEALQLVNSLFKGNFVIRGRNITIGTAGLAVEKIFGYGKDKGLFTIEQQTNNDALIITRLRAYGSTRNIPDKYYNSLKDANGKPLIPESQYVKNLMLPSFAENGGDAYIDSPDIDKLGVREGTVFFDGSDSSIPDIYPSLEGMTAEELKAAGFQTESTGDLDVIVSSEQIEDNGEPPIEGQGKIQETFWVTIKDIGFDINDHLTTATAQISMKTGMCAGRAFDITKCEKITGGYKLTLKRDEDSDLGLYFPYNRYNIKSGDKFVLLEIEMPDIYIKTAEQRLLKHAEEYLRNNDKSKYTYVPKIDSVFMARNPQFHDSLKEGDIFNFKDTDLGIDASVIIQSLTIKEGGAVPEYDITLFNDKIISGSIEKIQNAISSLANNIGITATEAKGIFRAMIDVWYPTWFNQKLHTYDDVQFANAILKNFQTDNFSAGPLGAGTGTINQNELQTDNLLVRKLFVVLEMLVQKMRFQGGVMVLSAADGIKVTEVEELSDRWRCYFNNDSGNIPNTFMVNDQGRIQNYTGRSQKYLWSLIVGTGDDYIELSKTDKDGTGIPSVGDDVVQLGNRSDTTRQMAVMLSAANGECGIVTYFNINSFDLSGKEGSWIGSHGGKKGAMIRGEFKFTSGKTVESSIKEADDKANDAIDKANDAYSISTGINESVNNILSTLIPDLQDQIDGNIMSWDGSVIPTLSNYPANQWTTNTEKDRHIGDTYDYYFVQNGENVSKRYKFRKVGSAYEWTLLADSDAARLEVELKETLGIVNSKNSITYGTRPNPPYSIDDIWISTSKSMYVCRVQRDKGSTGLESDWELVNDTQIRLNNMASDGVISKEEKPNYRNSLDQIKKEYATYNGMTTSVSKTALTNAYNNVVNYMTGTLKVNDNTDTGITESQRNQFNVYLAAWYSSVTEFTNLIANEIAKRESNNAKTAAVNEANEYTNQKTYQETIFDLTTSAYDVNKYYPVTIALQPTVTVEIRVDSPLNSSWGQPSWATHGSSKSFSLLCVWRTNGAGWGTLSVNRTIDMFAQKFASVNVAGSIGQMTNSSNEYIYVRGGGKYRFRVGAGGGTPALRTSAFTASNETINILDSVVLPTPALTKLSADISATNDHIKLLATKEQFNSLGEKTLQLESSINTTAGNIEAISKKVTGLETSMSGMITSDNFVSIFSSKKNALANEVISSINVAPGTVKISAKNINLDGTVVVGTGGNEVRIENGKLKAVNAEITGKIVATEGVFNGELVAQNGIYKISINPNLRGIPSICGYINGKTVLDLSFTSFQGYNFPMFQIIESYNNMEAITTIRGGEIELKDPGSSNYVSISSNSIIIEGAYLSITAGGEARFNGPIYFENVTKAPGSNYYLCIDRSTGRLYYR